MICIVSFDLYLDTCKSVISSVPNYFNNTETLIICYQYNKPIRSAIFNFNKTVTNMDTYFNTSSSWDCLNSIYSYPLQGMLLRFI